MAKKNEIERKVLSFKELSFHFYPNWYNNIAHRKVKLLEIITDNKDKKGQSIYEFTPLETKRIFNFFGEKVAQATKLSLLRDILMILRLPNELRKVKIQDIKEEIRWLEEKQKAKK